MLLPLAALLFLIALFPYLVYLAGIYFGKKPHEARAAPYYPDISIIMSAYNEERVIGKRIANLQECTYPKERMEIIFVDDCSSDGTKKLAESFLERSGIRYRAYRKQSEDGNKQVI